MNYFSNFIKEEKTNITEKGKKTKNLSRFVKKYVSKNPWLVEIDNDFLKDPFNLYGVKEIVPDPTFVSKVLIGQIELSPNFDRILKLSNTCDNSSSASHNSTKPEANNHQLDQTDSLFSTKDSKKLKIPLNIEKQCEDFYAMAHRRYILTQKGLEAIRPKIESGIYGVCPRYLCHQQKLLPYGHSIKPKHLRAMGFCPLCHDIYEISETQDINAKINPHSNLSSCRHHLNENSPKRPCFIDGCNFGPTFPLFFLQMNRDLIPTSPIYLNNPIQMYNSTSTFTVQSFGSNSISFDSLNYNQIGQRLPLSSQSVVQSSMTFEPSQNEVNRTGPKSFKQAVLDLLWSSEPSFENQNALPSRKPEMPTVQEAAHKAIAKQMNYTICGIPVDPTSDLYPHRIIRDHRLFKTD